MSNFTNFFDKIEEKIKSQVENKELVSREVKKEKGIKSLFEVKIPSSSVSPFSLKDYLKKE